MHINYLNDRKELGFSCINDINAIKQLQLSNLKYQVIWTLEKVKGKKTVILIGSKKVLVAILFAFSLGFSNINTEVKTNPSLFPVSEVYQSRVIPSYNLGLENDRPTSSDIILGLIGGSENEKLTAQEKQEQQRLAISVLSKLPESGYRQISINKLLNPVYQAIKAALFNENVWRIVSESQKPLPTRLGPVDNLGIAHSVLTPQDVQNKQPKLKGSSSLFAEAFPNSRPLSPVQKKVQYQLKMAKMKKHRAQHQLMMAQNNLRPDGLSKNHEQLPEAIKSVEKKTQKRRQQPLCSSETLGDSYQYAGPQLVKKGVPHLTKDYNISTVGKTPEEIAIEYLDIIEYQLKKPNLYVDRNATLCDKEPVIVIGEPESQGITIFENNPLYRNKHFISHYRLSDDAYKEFVETGEVGISDAERAEIINEAQKVQAQRERQDESSLFNTLPEKARISNKQLREVEGLKEQLGEDPNFSLTKKQNDLMELSTLQKSI